MTTPKDGVDVPPAPREKTPGEREGEALARMLSHPGWGKVIIPGEDEDGVPVVAAGNPSLDQGPCTVCGKLWRDHGTCPVYEDHHYTPASGVQEGCDAQG